MVQIEITSLKNKIKAYVDEFYTADAKPDVPVLPKEHRWVKDMIEPFIENALVHQELDDLENITKVNVTERMKPGSYDDSEIRRSCIKTKGYEILNKLSEDKWSFKFLVKNALGQEMAAKIEPMPVWRYNQKREMRAMLQNEINIAKKAFDLGIGPKMHEIFICFNDAEDRAYKVYVTDYITGIPLTKWLESDPDNASRKRVANMLRKKIDIMHANSIIHNRLNSGNVILQTKGKNKATVSDCFITDYIIAFDMNDKTIWDFNEWMRQDRNVLRDVEKTAYGWNISDDVKNYVASKLLDNKYIEIV